MDITTLSLGVQIRNLREALGLSQTDFAAKLGIYKSPKSRISQWENGHRNPSTATLQRISKSFSVKFKI